MSDQEKNPVRKIDQLLGEVGTLSKKAYEPEQADNSATVKQAKNSIGTKESNALKTKGDNRPEKVQQPDGSGGDGEEPVKSKKKWYILGAVVLVLAVLGGVYALLSMPLTEDEKNDLYENGTFIQGISVFDVDVSGETIESAREKLSDKVDFAEDEVLLELKLKDTVIPVKAADLQVANTIDSVLREAMLYGREGHLFKRLMDQQNARNNGQNFDVAIYTDEASLQSLVNTIVTTYSVPAKDADVQINAEGSEKFTFIPEQVGIQISPDGLADKIKTHIESKADGYIELDYSETQPKVTEATLRENMVLRSTYSTNVSGATGRRKNIILAASKINGQKVMPGETHNIEQELGPRTKANGWNIGGEFVNGELVNGYGGGICQVSTTLFNSVIRGDLEIVERSNHSQTVGYVPLGFDATISSGGPYFIWKNNTDYPIFIFATASMDKVTIDLYGAPLPYGNNVTYEQVVSATGTVTSGRRVQSALVFYNDGKEVHRISWSSSYRGKPVKITTTASTTAAPTTTAATNAPAPTRTPTTAATTAAPTTAAPTTTAKPTTTPTTAPTTAGGSGGGGVTP